MGIQPYLLLIGVMSEDSNYLALYNFYFLLLNRYWFICN